MLKEQERKEVQARQARLEKEVKKEAQEYAQKAALKP